MPPSLDERQVADHYLNARIRQAAVLLTGLTITLIIAVIATILGRLEPVIGGPVFGVVLGMALAPLLRPGATLRPGISFSGKFLLQTSIVVLGTGLSLGQVVHDGLSSLP